MPLIRRIPKLGFRSHRPLCYQEVNLEDLNRFEDGTVVQAQALKDKGCIHNIYKPYKILGNGELKKALTIEAYCFSKAALDKITKAGGKAQTVDASIIKKQTTQKEN